MRSCGSSIMTSVQPLRSIFIISLHLSSLLPQSKCQTTPFDEYGKVTVENQIPSIPNETEKTYTTTIKLEKITEGVTFVPNSFAIAAGRFYATALLGFIQVTNVQSTEISSSIIQVTYDVRYSYSILLGDVNGDDSMIQRAIGNIAAVAIGLNAQADILSLYSVVVNDDGAFSFGGSSVCEFATCNGTYISCIETTDGINATCVSDCKAGYCGESGICFHSAPNVVPTCRCTSLPDLWIIGERCETKFPLWLVVLLAVIGFLIIILVIIIVIICVRRRQKKQKRKEELLNSVPKSYQNNAFANNEIRTATIVSRTTISPTQANPPAFLIREDSFETVSSSELPPSEYRPRPLPNRRSRSSSATTSTFKHHHHRHHNGGHHNHHRRRHNSSDESPRHRENGPARGRSHQRIRHEKESPVLYTSSSQSEIDEKDPKNLSLYEVVVNDLDLETYAASSVAQSSTKSSPIRWLPPKAGQPRPGWVPSLGPMMYDLPISKKTNADASQSLPRRREGGTDV